ncbi:hypothetical protein BGZ68_001638, partial [Mortierella alpina]
MSAWREFFEEQRFSTKQRGSASSAWLRIIRSDPKRMGDWLNEKQEREVYWSNLKKTEDLEGYVEDITELVVKDKVAVATKHTSDVAAHLEAKSKIPSRVGTVKRAVSRPLPAAAKGKAKRTVPKVTGPQLPEPWKALMEVALALAADAYHLPTPKNRTRAVLDPLLRHLAGRTPKDIQQEARILKGRYQEKQRAGAAVPEKWEAILDIVEQVCRLVLRPSFDGNGSEADVVAEWKTVLHTLLMDSNVYMRSGECVSQSSKDIKAMLDDEYDEFGTFGRKVDLIFHANGTELSNLEFKVTETPEADIQIQNRKNIRLNRAIMKSQQDACEGIKSPILFFDFQGWHGSMFALYAFEDVFVAKYVGAVGLPRTKSGLQKFLKGETLELLFTFAEHLVTMAEVLQETREEKEELAAKKRHMAIFTRQITPPRKERRISGNVFLTPTKR